MASLRSSALLRNVLTQIHMDICNCRYSSYYRDLGLTQNATQADIKQAYYKLSKDYHPDRNQGSDVAAENFRKITQAYEVLGNLRLRKMYDKGIIYGTTSQYSQHDEVMHEAPETPDIEDDPQTKFYKSRFRKSTVGDSSGRTPIYDYDEWSRAHYGKSFDRRQAAKNKFDRKQSMEKSHSASVQNEIVIALMLGVLVIMYVNFAVESKLDTPKTNQMKKSELEKKTRKSDNS